MGRFLFLFIGLVIVISSYAASPPRYYLTNFLQDAKFIGTVTITSGKALHNELGKICGIAYEGFVTNSVIGTPKGNSIKLHHLKDIRTSYGVEPLEVGSDYFIYAENRNTHKLLQLSDGMARFPQYSEECHTNSNALYIYREFSDKIKISRGEKRIEYTGSWGMRLIQEFKEANAVYYTLKHYEDIIGKKSYTERMDESLRFEGFVLKELFIIVDELNENISNRENHSTKQE